MLSMNLSSYQQRNKLIKRIIFWSIIIGGLVSLFFVQTSIGAFAADPINVCDETAGISGCLSGTNDIQSGREGVTAFILDIVRFFIYISAAIAVGFSVWGAYLMITSSGDDDKYGSGVKSFRNAVIGLILAILSLTAVNVVAQIVSGFRT